MNELELFEAALAIVDPSERNRFLDWECTSRPELRQRIDRLLAAHFQSHAVLDQAIPLPAGVHAPALEPTLDFPSNNDSVGTVIAGKYTLVEVIGEGGMGSVWRAKQTEPVKRFVAVKLIKAGMDSKQVLARFEAERQALALMDHPNIAKVLDGGLHQQRPFFVMELVKGVPITEYCDARKMTPKERLELFVPVCQAIQHAHQKGIIHRDIKPSNVLIAMYDDQPVVKVIDFGVAKATGGTLTEQTIDTGFGAVVGTPQYMSPEQATFNNLDIDTRSDVYALGVLLYELLTGSPPFTQKELEKKGLLEILRVVREEEPPRPSTKLSTAEALPTLSANRGTNPKQLTGLLKNELDWIVMKALEKDRVRRYDTANGFAADVLRYLNGEAVQAHPPSPGYRLRKFARKHRAMLTTALAIALLLIVGIAASSWFAFKATQAEAIAKEKKIQAEAASKVATEKSGLLAIEAMLHMSARLEAEEAAEGLKVDLDLSELNRDSRLGLLRLVKPYVRKLEDIHVQVTADDGSDIGFHPSKVETPRSKALHEFKTLTVLASGQQYASLLPPIPSQTMCLGTGNPNLLSLDANGVPTLVEIRSGRAIAELRVANEHIVNCGLSPDGRWAFTDDLTSVLRIWDAHSGSFVSATSPRENRYGNPEGAPGDWRKAVLIAGDRAITRRCIVKHTDLGNGATSAGENWEGPVELWDIATGHCISRLDAIGRLVEQFRFESDGKIISVLDNQLTLVLYSAESGVELSRFPGPNDQSIQDYAVSPSGNHVAVISNMLMRIWDTKTRETIAPDIPFDLPGQFLTGCDFVADDLIRVKTQVFLGPEGEAYFQPGQTNPILLRTLRNEDMHIDRLEAIRNGSLLRLENHPLFDIDSGMTLTPPPNQKFHPLLAEFANDGRFVFGVKNRFDGAVRYEETYAIDTRTEKELHLPNFSKNPIFISDLGWVGEKWTYENGIQLYLLPASVAISSDVLQLWAQLAVRGELAEDGTFVKWDESTWERKRQELAAVPPPIEGFPFPGHVAQDKLHWLRGEFKEAKDDADRLRLANKLLEKAASLGDQSETTRWRNESKRLADAVAKSQEPVSESGSTNDKQSSDQP